MRGLFAFALGAFNLALNNFLQLFGSWQFCIIMCNPNTGHIHFKILNLLFTSFCA